MNDQQFLQFHDVVIELDFESAQDIQPTLDFLGTHFVVTTRPTTKPFVNLRFTSATVPPINARWDDVHVRKSASDFFTIPARYTLHEGRELVICVKNGTQFTFDRSDRSVSVCVGSGAQLELIELIRDLVLKEIENRGAVVLHATAAYRAGTIVAISGAKGAGKSTILLELVEKFGYQILSGDKTILREQPDGSVHAFGWPDYPHLGYSTVVKYPGLPNITGITTDYQPDPNHAFSPYGKFAVDPAKFRSRFALAPMGVHGMLSVIICPEIGPGNQTEFKNIVLDVEELTVNLESAFTSSHAQWHHFIEDDRSLHIEQRARILAAVAEIPALSLTGPGDLTVDPLELI
jgi:hypothetical protein